MRVILLLAGCLCSSALCAAEAAPSQRPDPVRLWGEIEAFARQDSLAAPPPGAVDCVGSSSLRMWHGRLRQDLAPAEFTYDGSHLIPQQQYDPALLELALAHGNWSALAYEDKLYRLP